MGFIELDPISRIEGHLGASLTTHATSGVTEADVHGNLWRGFENFLIGREPNDAITFTQRICGVCPLPHATASTFAVDAVYGYSPGYITFDDGGSASAEGVPPAAAHIRNLVYAAEFVMSHITHFYHLAAISYVQGPGMPPWTPYFDDSYYHALLINTPVAGAPQAVPLQDDAEDVHLWDAVILSYVKALRMRRLTFEAGALFAGRMPMTSSFVAGGVTCTNVDTKFADKISAFFDLMSDVGKFVIKEYVPLCMALGALYPNYDNLGNANITSGVIHPTLSASLWEVAGNGDPAVDPPTADNTRYGAGTGNFLAWGCFPNPDTDALDIAGGYVIGAVPSTSGDAGINDVWWLCKGKDDAKYDRAYAIAAVGDSLVEDVAFSRYVDDADWGYPSGGYTSAAYPGDITRTEPVRDDGTKYSWLKAPRWKHDGKYYACEVGPFARLVVNNWYPIDESATLAATVNPGGGLFGFADYEDDTTAGEIDAAMVDATLAAGLVTDGLAAAGVTGIGGIIAAWLLNMVGGKSTMDRLRARALEALVLVQLMLGAYDKDNDRFNDGTPGGWLGALELEGISRTYKSKATPMTPKTKFGVSEAPRGALAHFVSTNAGKITAYQCVVPTTWNASPKDNFDAGDRGDDFNGRGAMEQAMIGIPYAATACDVPNADGTTDTGAALVAVEGLRVAQSFDPCIACAVH